MPAIMEPGFAGLWAAKQTARGTAATVASKRYSWVGGDINLNRSDGSENVADLAKYNPTVDWVNSILGAGTPAIQATPVELAHLLWLFHGAETVTAVTGPPAASKHTFTPQPNRGFYSTFWRRVGQSSILRQKFNDCLITQMQIEGSTANKAVRVTPSITSLDPGEVFTADPTSPASLPTIPPYLYTDGQGSFTINGTVFNGQSQFSLVINDAWDTVFGDDVLAFEFVQGTPVVTLSATAYFDQVALARWNMETYGSTSPAVGTKPIKRIMPLGSYSFTLAQRDNTGALTGNAFALTIPSIKWTLPDAPNPNPDGGSTEVAFAGTMRPTTSPAYTIDVSVPSSQLAFTT